MGFWQNKRVLVTGAGGFIGSHLTDRLVRAGAKVRAVAHYNNAKTKELTGWQPTVSLRDGLIRTIEFVQANLNRFKPDIYNV